MKKNIQTGLLFCCLTLFFACGGDTTNQEATDNTNYDEMAQELCKCMTPLMEIQKKIMVLSEEGKVDEIKDLLDEVEALSAAGDQCVQDLEEKYGEVGEDKETKANEAFKKACPEIAQMLEAGEAAGDPQ